MDHIEMTFMMQHIWFIYITEVSTVSPYCHAVHNHGYMYHIDLDHY
jgi:hypothetical protein